MEFLRPWVLAFTPLIAVPILIHLFGHRARRVAKFSWVKLLKTAKTEGIRRQKPFEILLMILRTIVFASLIFAFAEPVMIQGLSDIKALYIDISYSMSPFVQDAQKLMERIQNAAPNVKVRFFADRIEDDIRHPTKTFFSSDLGVVPSNSMVFTDIQRTMLRTSSKAEHLVIVTPDRIVKNCAITDLEIGELYLMPEVDVPIRVKVTNFSEEPFQGKIEIFNNGNSVGGWDVLLNSGESSEFEGQFRLNFEEVEARLTPDDELDADNRRFAYLPKVDSVKVVVIGSNRYLQAALAPKLVHTPFQVTTLSKIKTYTQITDADVIAFFGDPDVKEAQILGQALRDGKGVVLILSPDSVDTSGLDMLKVKIGRKVSEEKMGDAVVSKGMEILSGTPLLKTDRGTVIATQSDNLAVIGVPFDPIGSDFVYVPEFVTFVQSLFLRLQHKVDVRYVAPGQSVIFPIETGDVRIEVVDPSGHKIKPVPMPMNGGWGIKLNIFEEPGLYRLFEGNKLVGVVVVNIDPLESDTRQASKDELNSALGSFDIVKFGQEGGKPLKSILLKIAALAILAEIGLIVLANWKFKRASA